MTKTLFIVDDDPDIITTILRLLKRTLEPLGVTIKTFNSPLAALKEIDASGLPTVILTDDLMPGMTGREFAKELRENKEKYDFKGEILMLSGTANDDVLENGVINRRLKKPFNNVQVRQIFVELFSPPSAPLAE